MMKPKYKVVSFSGGKDSTAMTLHMIELGMPIDEVICCDTGKEFPAMYRHIQKVRKVIEDAGIKFTLLKAEKDFDYWMYEHEPKRRGDNIISRYGHVKGMSWAGSRQRWCTNYLKGEVIRKYLKKLKQEYDVIQYIGLAADEQYRLERESNKKEDHIHPLVEWKWVEQDCLNYCYAKGFDWEGLYEIFKRVSCWCCPLQSLEELRKLRTYFPDLWEELKEMDRKTWRNFRADYSVDGLEVRFQFEEERIRNGLSITNRDFHNQLKNLLKEKGLYIEPRVFEPIEDWDDDYYYERMENTMEFDYAKVKGKIKEKFGTQANFANAMNLSSVAVSDKLNNKSSWTQKEIDSACVLLGIEPVDIPTYFFTAKVKVL